MGVIIEQGDQKEQREGDLEYVLPKKSGEIDHLRREGDEERGKEGLSFIEVAQTVDRVHQGNQRNTKQGGEEPSYQIRILKEGKHPCGSIVEEGSMVRGIVHIDPFLE
jgi:hypothetical protein